MSQDENEMGRFLRDQGATDKTKAGKMMIAVGKAQSYAAQQRYAATSLCLLPVYCMAAISYLEILKKRILSEGRSFQLFCIVRAVSVIV